MNVYAKNPTYAYVTHPSLKEPYALPSMLTQDMFDSAINYKADPDDTFVVSYPKSGTTWAENILYLLRSNGVPLEKGENIDNIFPFLEFSSGDAVEQLPTPRTIKSHFYRSLIPFHKQAKYVFVARNPKDVVVSFYYHTIGFKSYQYADGKFDDFFEIFLSGKCDSGDYFKYVSEWYQESKTNRNVHMMLYEDMKNDLRREIIKLTEFLGSGNKERLMRNNEKLLNDVIEHSSFSNMQASVKNFCQETFPKNISFVRKGVIGDWKNHLSREQNERIEKKISEVDQQCPGFAGLWSNYEHVLKF